MSTQAPVALEPTIGTRILTAIIKWIRQHLLIERDLIASNLRHQADLAQIAEFLERNTALLDRVSKSHVAQYDSLGQYVLRQESELQALKKRLKFYGEHNDSLKYTKREYDRLLERERQLTAAAAAKGNGAAVEAHDPSIIPIKKS